VVFFCGVVVFFCGVDLFFETAKIVTFSFVIYPCPPFFLPFVPIDPFVFRCSFFSWFLISCILLSCTDSEIIFSVVEAVVVDVVTDEIFGYFHYFTVHPDLFVFSASHCIISA